MALSQLDKEQLAVEVLAELTAAAQSLENLTKAESLENITSLPGYDTEGNLILAPLELLEAAVKVAVGKADELIEQLNGKFGELSEVGNVKTMFDDLKQKVEAFKEAVNESNEQLAERITTNSNGIVSNANEIATNAKGIEANADNIYIIKQFIKNMIPRIGVDFIALITTDGTASDIKVDNVVVTLPEGKTKHVVAGSTFGTKQRGYVPGITEVVIAGRPTALNFGYFEKMTKCDTSMLDTSALTSWQYMFTQCTSLKEVDITDWDDSNITSMYGLAMQCYSNFVIKGLEKKVCPKNTSLRSLFFQSRISTTDTGVIDLSSLDTSKVTNFLWTFCQMNYVEEIKINIDFSSATNTTDTFWANHSFALTGNLSNLPANIELNFGRVKKITGVWSNMKGNMKAGNTDLDRESLLVILNGLYDWASDGDTSQHLLTLGSVNLAKLTDEDKAIATNKGWTLA